jgi:hypothetical protein
MDSHNLWQSAAKPYALEPPFCVAWGIIAARPLRCADQVGLARHGDSPRFGGAGFRRGRSCSTAGESGR